MHTNIKKNNNSVIYAVPVLGTRWFHAAQTQLRCSCHHFSFINHQVDNFKKHFRPANVNIQLCNTGATMMLHWCYIGNTLWLTNSLWVSGAVAFQSEADPSWPFVHVMPPRQSLKAPLDSQLFAGPSLGPLASALHVAKVQTDSFCAFACRGCGPQTAGPRRCSRILPSLCRALWQEVMFHPEP